MNVILFDTEVSQQLLPITFTRPSGDIRVGAFTIREKWAKALNCKISFLTASYLSEKFSPSFEQKNLYVDGTVLPSPKLAEALLRLEEGQKLVSAEKAVAFIANEIESDKIESVTNLLDAVDYIGFVPRLTKSWDIIAMLKTELLDDLNILLKQTTPSLLPNFVKTLKPENIRIGSNVLLENCTLNASEGPIFIDDHAEIMDGAIIRGPVYIGKHSIVKMGAKIYGPFSCGEHCRVGGEVADSVFQSFSNKGHDGFLGHSYLGEWCNLGADTNVSNLKNNYDNVRMWNYVSQHFERTGLQFLGMIMGDHSKTGINTMINTGTVVGVSCNIFGSDFPRNFIPSFTQGGAKKITELPLKQALSTAKTVMERRAHHLDELEISILTSVFDQTKMYRKFM